MGILIAPSSVPVGWQMEHVGGGGYTIGLDTHTDGTRVAKVDTLGGYIWDTSPNLIYGSNGYWRQLVLADNIGTLPTGQGIDDPARTGSLGFQALRINPQNSSTLWGLLYGRPYKSTDRGVTWTDKKGTGWTPSTYPDNNNNDSLRTFNHSLAISPTDSNHIIAGLPNATIKRTTDGGTNWSAISGIATSTTKYNVLFISASHILIASRGTGVYESTNSGASFSLTTGGPIGIANWDVALDGKVFAIESEDGSLWQFDSGTWTHRPAITARTAILCSHTNAAHIYFVNPNSRMAYTLDRGVTAGGALSATFVGSIGDPTWFNAAMLSENNSSGAMAYDYATGGIIIGTGVGPFTTPIPNFGVDTSNVFTTLMRGNESLVSNTVSALPSGGHFYGVWDRGSFIIRNPLLWPTRNDPDGLFTFFTIGHDYASSSVDFIGVRFGKGSPNNVLKYTLNFGSTWSTVANPPLEGGDGINVKIAISTPDNWVLAPTGANEIHYTLNATAGGSATWTKIALTGAVGYGTAAICADRVTANKFYRHTYTEGVKISTDGGASWSNGWQSVGQSYSPAIDANANPGIIKSVPGNAGHLIFSAGLNGTSLWKSTNGGVTFTAVPGTYQPQCFGFGKANPSGSGYPAVFVWMYYNNGGGNVWGLWRSDNFDQATPTWTSYGNRANNLLAGVNDVCGDFNNFGDVFMAINHGIAWYNYA